jgi:PAS domain S-box-containing protein
VLDCTFQFIRDEQGKATGILAEGRDVTERKLAEKELLKSEEKYRSLVENAQEGIFQSTAEGHHITVNQAFANILGYESTEEVMATIADIPHQVYVHPDDRTKILQIIEKEGSVKGYEAEFYKKDGSKTWVSINMHAVRDEEGRLLYYQGINQDIIEKKNMERERQENIERLRKSLGATINAMAVTVETRDPYTAGHQRRVADLARAIAVEMNLKSEQIDSIRMASMIHDIGKISIPSEILSKPTKLTDLEFDLIKTHSQSGYNILKDIEFPWPVADVVLQHHERMNGSGYPQGLKGDDILLEARILAIADVVEAIASHRPYRPALGIDLAMEEISGNKGILYDADAVDACLKLFREKGYNLVLKKL